MKFFLSFIWNLIKWPSLIILCIVCFFFILTWIYIFIEMKKSNRKLPKASKRKKYSVSVWKRLFYEFPRMLALDFLNRNPDAFTYKGIIIFEGEQGNGKSISMIEFVTRMMSEFPKVKCIANLWFKSASCRLNHWKQLLTFSNGEFGVIAVIDELQNWFSCKDSKDFPPEMLSVVTQNRKNRRIIVGTAQSFYMLAKDIRTQCTEVRSCKTFFNCLTLVIRKKPICNSAGDVEKWKFLGFYLYVQTPELRASYDTYEVIQRFAKSGFTSKSERYNQNSETADDLVKKFRGE